MTLDLTVLEPGMSLGKCAGALEVRRDGVVLDSIPLHRILTLTVGMGVSISTDLLAGLADRGTVILVVDSRERPSAAVSTCQPWRDPRLLRAQALATNTGCALDVARELLSTKLLHQSRLLHTWARSLSDSPLRPLLVELGAEIAEDLKRLSLIRTPEEARLLEAQAARLYWRGFSLMVPFRGRKYPRAQDLPNQLLNYGYAVLARHWLRISLLAGLEPHLGVLHSDRVGRPGLVLDLMEPWRPWVDRTIVGLFRQNVPLHSEQGGLTMETRQRLLNALHRAFSARAGRASSLRSLWVRNTRQLAAHFAGGASWACPRLHP